MRNDSGRDLPCAADVGVALLDLSFHPIAIDAGGASILSAMSDGGHAQQLTRQAAATLPTVILHHLRSSGRASGAPAEVRFTVGDHLYVGRSYLLEAADGNPQGACIVLYLEREADIADACLEVSRRYRLTDREEEALRGVASGLTSKEVAQRMNISPSTVKTFLRLIMIKTGSPNRAGIVAKLFAPRTRPDGVSQDGTEAAPRRTDASRTWTD